MELLKAVNTVLPYLGEHPVTRIEGAKHPTVDLILASIDRQRLSLLAVGWWFNRLDLTIPVNSDGRIDVPKDSIAVYGIDCNVELDGEKFFNLDTGSRYFDKPIRVEIIRDIEFPKLPVYAAQTVLYNAASEVYLADFGRENTVPELQSQAEYNMTNLKQEHLRKSKFNARKKSKNSMWRVKFR